MKYETMELSESEKCLIERGLKLLKQWMLHGQGYESDIQQINNIMDELNK